MKDVNSDLNSQDKDRIRSISSLDELPKEVADKVREFKKKITNMVLESHNESSNKDPLFSLLDFIAFQQFQIHALQQETQSIHEILLSIAKTVDSKADRVEW